MRKTEKTAGKARKTTGKQAKAAESTELRENVKRSLIEQLENKGAGIDVFRDMINDYMTMWDEKEALKEDMKDRGLRYGVVSGNGFEIEKDNPSYKIFPLVNKQMLMLLKQMGLTTEDVRENIPDDEL